jgi:acetyl-CoA synthetase
VSFAGQHSRTSTGLAITSTSSSASQAPALRVVDDAGGDQTYSFAQLSKRSCQVAAFLAAQGIEPGDRILLMLPNVVSLWEVMLAAIRLGAIVIPATTLLERDDLADRLERGRVKAVITDATLTARFTGLSRAPVRIAVGAEVAGWASYAASHGLSDSLIGPMTRADDLLLLYFTSAPPLARSSLPTLT